MTRDHDTDLSWQQWGERDPYFSVLTVSKYRRERLDAGALREFFESGRVHVQYVLDVVRLRLVPGFAATRALDFGCGVGRTLIPLASAAREVVGVDVSPAMLGEARANCEAHAVGNVQLLASDDALSPLQGDFDLIHSSLVFQHIPVERGRAIFARLLSLLRPGGIGAFHFAYAKSRFADNWGAQPALASAGPRAGSGLLRRKRPAKPTAAWPETEAASADPEMQMNSYPLNEVFFCLQRAGIASLLVDFTDHGGELGVFLFFLKPAVAPPGPPV
jgi:SAM-dependent methyltransferase